ncbi:alpha/beta hydrolase, partial [Pantoea sp. SIMBA_133]
FNWSGSNSAKARLDAAISLELFLDNLIDEYSASQVFIIAHSHGGNIAMHCLRSTKHKDKISGLFTFSTPFLHLGARN